MFQSSSKKLSLCSTSSAQMCFGAIDVFNGTTCAAAEPNHAT